MIITFLIVLVVALVLANLFVSIARPKRRKEKGFTNIGSPETYEPEVVNENALAEVHEKTSLIDGKVLSLNHRLGLLNERIVNLEKAVTQIAEHKIKQTTPEKEIDVEKVEFRIKVLEQQMDTIKKPKEKQKTFYGTLDSEMEKKVKSLAFNKKEETKK